MKRWSLALPLLLTAALVGTSVSAATEQANNDTPVTNALTLAAAIQLALENNPNLRASGARVRAAGGRADQAGRWTNPELELSAEDWPVNNGSGFSDAKQLIGIAQTLPYPGKKALERRIGRAGVDLSAAELMVRRTELVRDTKAAFYQVLAAERMTEVSDQLVQVAESAAATARKRVDAGAAAYQEQLRSEVQLEQARAQLAAQQRELAIARHLLAMMLGRPDLQTTALAGELGAVPAGADKPVDPAGEDWLLQHPSMVAAQANLDRAQLEHRRARLAAYPDVKVAVAGGRIGATDESIIQLGVSFPLPLLDSGQGARQETLANVDAASAELQTVRQQLQREWSSAGERCRTALAEVTRYRERILPKSREALLLVQTGFEQGKLGFIDLLDTQRTDAESQLAYQGKLLELHIALAERDALLRPQTNPTSTSE